MTNRSQSQHLFDAAVSAHRAGRVADAQTGYRKVLEINSAHADAMHLLGVVELQEGRSAEAERFVLAALRHRRDAVFLTDLGSVLTIQGKKTQAEVAFREALGLNPDFAEAHNRLGILLAQTQRFSEAQASFRRVAQLRPDSGEAYSNLGQALSETGRLLEAEAAFRRALQLNPDHAEGHNNLGIVLSKTGRYAEAETAYRNALALKPCYAEAHNNLGSLLYAMGRFNEAEIGLVRALVLNPSYVHASFNLGMLLLATGRYAEAWPHYESRCRLNMVDRRFRAPDFSYPRWQGESLIGKSIVLVPEQGFGDYIQFVRYVPMLKRRGATRISVVCDPVLMPVLMTVEGVDQLVTDEDPLPPHDFWSFPLSLPRHFGTTVDTIPRSLPYVRALQSRLEYWRMKLPVKGLKVGLAWKGRQSHGNDSNRSLHDISALEPLLSLPEITFVSLQHKQGDETPHSHAAQRLYALEGEIRDFGDVAAIAAQLDLVICVDTAIAHLVGALDKPCWVLIPAFGCDWRWMKGRTDSPWYPASVRLFRQEKAGDWSKTIQELTAALIAWTSASRG